MRIVMVPGIGGSDERHWQTLWREELRPQANQIEPASWDAPDLEDWQASISREVGPATVLVAHSLGCLAVTAWLLDRGPSTVIGAFLVSPPDPGGPAFPAQARSFFAPRATLPVPAVVVASSNDPFADIRTAREFAQDWGAALVDAGPVGHINSSSGVGAWEAGRAQLQAFLDSLPPVSSADAQPGPLADIAEVANGSDLRIARDSVDQADVQELLSEHMRDMLETSPPESVHALTAAELAEDGISFWTIRAGDGSLLGCGALKHLGPDVAELKSMRVVRSARRSGIGAALLEHLMRQARSRGYRCLQLETGAHPFFEPARRLYERAGFIETAPFADYSDDPNSVYMGLRLP
jgi:uncharacterized protein